MSDREENSIESIDQSEEIFRDLLRAERKQEITQTTTMQGQIVALVMILRDAGILSKEHVDAWEKKSEHVANLLNQMATASEVQSSDSEEDQEGQLEVMLAGMHALIDFAEMMGNDDHSLDEAREYRESLSEALIEMRSGS